MKEDLRILGVVHRDLEVKIMLYGLPRRLDSVAAVFTSLAAAGTRTLLAELRPPDGVTGRRDIVFTVDRLESERAMWHLWDRRKKIGFVAMHCEEAIRRVSLIGRNMGSRGGIVARFAAACADAGAPSELISVTPDEIAAIVPAGDATRAVAAIRDVFGMTEAPLAAWDGPARTSRTTGMTRTGTMSES